MMNFSKRSRRWPLFAVLPALIFLVMLFVLSCVPKEQREEQPGQENLEQVKEPVDSAGSFQIQVMENAEPIRISENDHLIVILMNRKNEIMISGKITDAADVSKVVADEYMNNLASLDIKKSVTSSPTVIPDSETMIYIQKDVQTDSASFALLIKDVVRAMMEVRQNLARELFETDYDSLGREQIDLLKALVPGKVYFLPGKNMSKRN